MANKVQTSLLSRSTFFLAILITAGYAGNYFSLPFGFGVDFLFGSIAVLMIISLYGIWWGTIAALIAGSYTITLWQHPYALIIFTCEALFVAWRLRQGSQNLLIMDMIFWLLIGIPLVWLFYGNILRVGVVTTSIILVKQPVNGIFNALIASLLLNHKLLYRWANLPRRTQTISFEQTLLNLLVAFVLFPALMLMVVNNQIAMQHEQTMLKRTLQTSAQNLATDLLQWHKSSLKLLRQLADFSSQTKIANSARGVQAEDAMPESNEGISAVRPSFDSGDSPLQMQQSLELANNSFPIFEQIYIINADRKIIAAAPSLEDADGDRQLSQPIAKSDYLNFAQLDIPRKPEIILLRANQESNSTSQQQIIQTLPILHNNRWIGNIVAVVHMDFIKQILQTESYTLPLNSTLLDENRLIIATTDKTLNPQTVLDRLRNGEINYLSSHPSEPSIYHWLPIREGKPLIARWKESYYGQELLIDEEIPLTLVIEAPAAPHIDYLQMLYIRSLTILLLIAVSAILMARFLSRLLVKPILTLANFTTNLPEKLLQHTAIEWPRSSVQEINILVTNFEVMSETIEQNIQQIQQTNQQLKQAKEAAEIANLAKDQFLANISHELKTPLNSIIGYTRLIQRYLANPDSFNVNSLKSNQTDWLKIIQQSSKYLLNLINDILDFAKAEALKTKLYPSQVNFPAFLDEIVEIIVRKAIEKNILFEYESSGELPKYIYADEKRLRQVLLNLLSNAVKFTDRGQVILKVIIINKSSISFSNPIPQIDIRFTVIDTGIGIDCQDLTKIFQPFEQVGNLESKQDGTGLGLAICQQLVELMGGKLQVQSELGKGSIFWFDVTFPQIMVNSEVEPEFTSEIVGYKGKRSKLLVIDDIRESRLLFLNLLEPLGFEVITAENGQQGLELVRQSQPDLILTDLFMPVRTGFTLIPELRQIKEFKQIPIIAVSASSFEVLERQSISIGCDAFLPKPIDDRKLLNLLEKYLDLEWIYQ